MQEVAGIREQPQQPKNDYNQGVTPFTYLDKCEFNLPPEQICPI
ncbi:hypothetical protein [Candidatus Nitrosocosmicus arcticus]|nr:hypothetical protein [Candidatus Nitrosocosmicus arcticus]